MVPRQVLSSPVGEPLAAAVGCCRVSVTELVLGGPRGVLFCSFHSAGSSPWGVRLPPNRMQLDSLPGLTLGWPVGEPLAAAVGCCRGAFVVVFFPTTNDTNHTNGDCEGDVIAGMDSTEWDGTGWNCKPEVCAFSGGAAAAFSCRRQPAEQLIDTYPKLQIGDSKYQHETP